MSKVLVTESSLTDIANAIRGKNGSTTTYKPGEMAAAITALESGGSGMSLSDFCYKYFDVDGDLNNGTITELTDDVLPGVTKIRDYAFYGSSLKTVNLPDIVEIGDSCFRDSSKLTSVSFSKCEKIQKSAFEKCSALTTINLPSINNSTTSLYCCFSECSALTTLDLSGWDTSNITSLSRAFWYCSALTTLDISSWDTSKVTDFSYMFISCGKLATIRGVIDMTSVGSGTYNYSSIFKNCTNLTGVKIKNPPSASNWYTTAGLTEDQFEIVT